MRKLLPGENLVLQDHPHWITIVGSLVVPVILLVLIAVADFTILYPQANGSGLYVPSLRKILSFGVIALALLWLIVVWIRWRSITYTLTDQRIAIETGVFGRQEKIIPIDRVQDCTTKQSIFGRILGYGRVEVDAAGSQGGEVLDDDNWRLITDKAMTVHLDVPFPVVWERIKKLGTRPLVANRSASEVEELYDLRRPRYEQAEHRVDGTRPAGDVADEVLQLWSA